MADTSGLNPFIFACEGGLILNQTPFAQNPGTATELENFEVAIDNIEAKLTVVSQNRADARPSEVEALEKERKELQKQLKAVDEQIEAKKTEKEKLLNPEKEGVKESQNKKI